MMRVKASELNDCELLALAFGAGSANLPSAKLMQRLEHYFERASAEHSLLAVEALLEVKGVSPSKACALLAGIELGRRVYSELGRPILEPEDALPHLLWMRDLKKEHFHALYLDTRRRLIGSETISVGTLDSSLVHPRELFGPAIERGASAILVAHNHPSGDPEPSSEDLKLTKRIESAAQLLGFCLLDHVVMGRHSFVSIRQRQLGGFLEVQPFAA